MEFVVTVTEFTPLPNEWMDHLLICRKVSFQDWANWTGHRYPHVRSVNWSLPNPVEVPADQGSNFPIRLTNSRRHRHLTSLPAFDADLREVRWHSVPLCLSGVRLMGTGFVGMTQWLHWTARVLRYWVDSHAPRVIGSTSQAGQSAGCDCYSCVSHQQRVLRRETQ